MGGGHNRSTIQGFYGAGQEDTSRKSTFVMDNDEPDVLLGTDQGANPVEYVLHALAGCLTTSLVYHAAAKGIRIDAVESRLEGDLDLRGFLGMSDEVRNGYDNVRVTFRIKADASEEQLQELCKLAQKRSPVFDIVTNAVPVTVQQTVSLNGIIQEEAGCPRVGWPRSHNGHSPCGSARVHSAIFTCSLTPPGQHARVLRRF